MSKTLKIVLIGIVGFFFSIATLEIDVFGYDNTFFDTYDSYVQIDNPVLQLAKNGELGGFALPGITRVPFSALVTLPFKFETSPSPPCFYKRKRYIVQSSLLI